MRNSTIVVTGGAGFIGSRIVRALNVRGGDEVIVVDDLTDGTKFRNLSSCDVADYWDQEEFSARIRSGAGLSGVRAIVHQGACSDTTQWDGRYMMRVNYTYSRDLLDFCLERQIPLVYASSAAVYGNGETFVECADFEAPLNVYGYSKLLFDNRVRKALSASRSQVVGLRYFNVYGPGEAHKGSMASVAFHFNRQLADTGKVRLFEGSGGYQAGEQRRDFVYVDDVAAVNLWFLDRPHLNGIFNVGTGSSASFNEVASAVIAWHGRGEIEYIPFPEHLVGKYQNFTEANVDALRNIGYSAPFADVRQGVRLYLDHMKQRGGDR